MAKRKAPRIKPPLDPESEAWNKIPWRKLEQHCFRIQKRIFRASQRGNTRAVHKLQKLLMKSQSARLLAVRRVTQENQGKKTAGIDGVKSVKPAERSVMANQIHPKNWQDTSPPVRRVWIPKPGKTEKRLRHSEQAWTGCHWFVEGDIHACFDHLDHTVMVSILAEKIHDPRFLRLINHLLQAG